MKTKSKVSFFVGLRRDRFAEYGVSFAAESDSVKTLTPAQSCEARFRM